MMVHRVWLKDGQCFDVVHDVYSVVHPKRRWQRWLNVWRRDGRVVAAVRNGRIQHMEKITDMAVPVLPDVREMKLTWVDGGERLHRQMSPMDFEFGETSFVIYDARRPLSKLLWLYEVAWEHHADEIPALPEDADQSQHGRARAAAKRSDEANRKRGEAHHARLDAREQARAAEQAAELKRLSDAHERRLRARREAAEAAAEARRRKVEAAKAKEDAKWAVVRAKADAIRTARKLARIDLPRAFQLRAGIPATFKAESIGPWEPTSWRIVGSIAQWASITDEGVITFDPPPHATAKNMIVVARDVERDITKSTEAAVRAVGPTIAEIEEQEERERAARRRKQHEAFAAETERDNAAAISKGSEAVAARIAELQRLHEEAQG